MQQRRKIATHCDDRHRRDHSPNSNGTCARKGSPAYDKCFLMIHYAILRPGTRTPCNRRRAWRREERLPSIPPRHPNFSCYGSNQDIAESKRITANLAKRRKTTATGSPGIDVPTFDAMDGRISFLMETGLSQTRWRPVIRRHAVPSDIIAPIRGLSETTGPATQSDAAAGNRASNNIRRAQPPAHTFMAARRLGICPRRRACSPSRSGGPRRHPAHQNRGPAR